MINNNEKIGCPFKRLNTRLHTSTKDSIVDNFKQHQINKHKEYFDILKKSFQENEDYYIHIQDHIDPKDLESFTQQHNIDNAIQFLNKKIKDYFWKGIIFENKENLTFRESGLQNIGNLGLDDVTNILTDILSNRNFSIEEILGQLDDEITLRLRNNVLIDSILHLNDFKHTIVTKDSEQYANSILLILKKNFNSVKKRFSPSLVADEFSQAMRADHMIDNEGFIPQLTFGCPVVNIGHGEIFKTFVKNFLYYFLQNDKKIDK